MFWIVVGSSVDRCFIVLEGFRSWKIMVYVLHKLSQHQPASLLETDAGYGLSVVCTGLMLLAVSCDLSIFS